MTQRLTPLTASAQWCIGTPGLRAIERANPAPGPGPDSLMARAGLAAARWSRALAPCATRVTVLCGPGNNGGDGLAMAHWLQRQGCEVAAVQCGAAGASADRARALSQASAAGVTLLNWPHCPEPGEVVVDALLGIGQQGKPRGAVADAVRWANSALGLRLALDVPTGLDAERGHAWDEALTFQSDHTLTFLAPKSGLFTGLGRQFAGTVWVDRLGIEPAAAGVASLWGAADLQRWLAWSPRALSAHAGHKGRQGDTWVVAGEASMAGAARLAARAALHAGAGRVYLLGPEADPVQPELMQRDALPAGRTVVAGCGGGASIASALPALFSTAAQLVLDADALNAIAAAPHLRSQLRHCKARLVLTPHPLEAARLLGIDTAGIQASRLQHAQTLADEFGATVVLKGSGTVVAHPGQPPIICTTGHASLATAGTGDVLAGWLGGLLAQAPDAPTQHLAALAATWHGAACGPTLGGGPLTASALVARMAALHPSLRPTGA